MEMIRTLRLARRSVMKARTQAANQVHAVVVTAPQELRDRLRKPPLAELVATAARFRPGCVDSLEAAARLALKSLASPLPTTRPGDCRFGPADRSAYPPGRTRLDADQGRRRRHRRSPAGGWLLVTTLSAFGRRRPSLTCAASPRYPPAPERPTATGLSLRVLAVGAARPTPAARDPGSVGERVLAWPSEIWASSWPWS